MSLEIGKPIDLTLEQLGNVSPDRRLSSVVVEGRNPTTNYGYVFGFIFEHTHPPYIKIDTEPRRAFLQRGTERDAQDALVALAQETRKRSGGSFNVHPLYGAVMGTRLTPVVPGFLSGFNPLDQRLTMVVYVTDDQEAHPNRAHREQAMVHGLDIRWDDEFRRYHPEGDVPDAIDLTPRSIAGLLHGLEQDEVLTYAGVARIDRE